MVILDEEELDHEIKQLEKVIDQIKRQLEESMHAAENYKKETISTQKQMWEDVRLAPSDLSDLDGLAQVWQFQVEIANQARKYKSSHKMTDRLERMYSSPYFGRIDFVEDGESKPEPVYIGLYTLVDLSGEILVYDWRAPISSMFYDFEIGRSSYKCPAGIIDGEIILKRQYKIANACIDYMFNSSLKINDDILQQILSKSVDNKMKTIITSIQREQNIVIRDDTHNILIVQGAAGSGKTSIALHRVAYLLYKYRESVNAENIIIFSPNQVFNDYVSNILPELGEENMHQTTFIEYFNKIISPNFKQEDMNDQIEYLLANRKQPQYAVRIESIKYKTSKSFIDVMKNYINYLENNRFTFEDIYFADNMVISKEEISELFKKDYAHMPLYKRLEKIKQRILYLLEPYEKVRVNQVKEQIRESESLISEIDLKVMSTNKAYKEFKPLKDSIDTMVSLDLCQIYIDLFKDRKLFMEMCQGELPQNFEEISNYTIEQLRSSYLMYEDMVPILFLKIVFDGTPNNNIKHVIIDEAQDYTPLQFEVLKQTFRHSNMTVLGDLNQSINYYMNIGKYESIDHIFKDRGTIFVNLNKSYRSTSEITDFSRSLLTEKNNVECLNRHGEKPKIIQIEDKEDLVKQIAQDIKELDSNGFKSIAVICKSSQQSHNLYKSIKDYVNISLVTKDDTEYINGVIIIPSYLSKGLEFDAVIICCDEEENDYCYEDERRLLYTVCTRALHVLHLYYFQKPPALISSIGSVLYDCIIC